MTLRASRFLLPPTAPLGDHVARVIANRPEKQVVGVYASGRIACMADKDAFRDIAPE